MLIEASVWIKLSYCPILISLDLAEIMPAVTVPPNPKGFPIAKIQSPTLDLEESPHLRAFNLFFGLTFNTAISTFGSLPTNLAFNFVSS